MRRKRNAALNRREFLGRAGAAGGAIGVLPLARRVLGAGGKGAAGAGSVTLFHTRFAEGEPTGELDGMTLVETGARSGGRCAVGEIDAPRKFRAIRVPIRGQKGRQVRVCVWVRSDRGSRCALWARTAANKRSPLGSLARIPRRWKQVTATYVPATNAPAKIEIIAPSSFNAPPGRAWVDEVLVTSAPLTPYRREHVEDFPALAADAGGRVWLAVLARPRAKREVRVYEVTPDGLRPACALAPEGMTGLDRPAIAAAADGCIVAFGFERDGRWRIAWARVRAGAKAGLPLHEIDCGGTSNISASLSAAGERACVVWESNAGAARGVYAAWLGAGAGGEPVRLSSPSANSYNPDVALLADGSAWCVWDTLRGGGANIWGARFDGERWSAERPITRGRRIERHPRLAVRGGEVWMAWQAQAFLRHRINNVEEQRVVAARLDEGGKKLSAPRDLFERVSRASDRLLRPQIAFDPRGRLWLTVRKSMGRHHGWQPLAWCYDGVGWHGPQALWPDQGRWRPVPLAWSRRGGLAAVQRDDLPKGWREQGIRPDWKGEVRLVAVSADDIPAAKTLRTAALAMPATDFRLSAHVSKTAADLPRQTARHAGRKLTLLWGDFHDHTDLSVCVRDMNPPHHDLYANERDIERLDFVAVTDHGYNFDRPQWAYNGEQTRANHDGGRFVTFLGEEWTSDHIQYVPRRSYRRYGHRNLIFLDPYHQPFHDSRDGDIPPTKLWRELKGVELISIPHQLADTGNCPTDWSEHDERLQPVAEIFQARESYEHLGCPRQARRALKHKGHFLQDAWAKGVVIGVIASPDHGGSKGRVGVWAKALTREAIFEAVRARHTFGTSGAKIGLLLTSGEAMMGDRVPRGESKALRFRVRAVAARPIRELVIWRNNEVAHRVEPGEKELTLDWTDRAPPAADRLWYYARVQCADDELAWSSPIWFV